MLNVKGIAKISIMYKGLIFPANTKIDIDMTEEDYKFYSENIINAVATERLLKTKTEQPKEKVLAEETETPQETQNEPTAEPTPTEKPITVNKSTAMKRPIVANAKRQVIAK